MRLRVLKEIGVAMVDISVVDAKTDDRKLRYSLSDNDRAGAWDDQALAELIFNAKDAMGNLDIFRVDLAPTINIDKILNEYGPTNGVPEDQVPEPEIEPICQHGEIFELGKHRMIIGDATKQETYDALLGKHKADLIFTDPPYNVNYKGTKFAPILNDNQTEEAFVAFCEEFMARIKENTKRGGVFYVCSGYRSFSTFVYAIKKTGMVFAGPIIWVKNNTSLGRNDYRHKHEMILKGNASRPKKAQPILYGWNGGRHYFFESRFEADVWEIPKRASQNMLHPTQKPLAMVQRAIRNSSRPGELVLDPFAGSGTTLIAAEREGREARIMELDPRYGDVIIRRFAAQGGPTEADIRATRHQAGEEPAKRRRTKNQGAEVA